MNGHLVIYNRRLRLDEGFVPASRGTLAMYSRTAVRLPLDAPGLLGINHGKPLPSTSGSPGHIAPLS